MTEFLGTPLWLTIAVGAGFVLDWLAIGCAWLKLKPFTKILAMTLVVVWTLVAVGMNFRVAFGLLLLAQISGLLGDFFLLLPNRFFLWGLRAFFAGHLFYIGLMILLFVQGVSAAVLNHLPAWGFGVGVFLWALLMAGYYFIFSPHLRGDGKERKLWISTTTYVSFLLIVMLFSFALFLLLPDVPRVMIVFPLGGLLFLVSDGLLAYNRFVRRIRLGQLWVRITYHLGQLGLAIGFVILFRMIAEAVASL